MNGHGAKYVAHRPAEDDDSIATEQFPEFDPSHDGSEEEEQDVVRDRNYTHRRASQTANGGATRGEGQEQGAPKASKAQEEAQQNNHRPLFDDDDGSSRRDLLSVDPRPESNRAPSQLQHQDEPQSAVTSVTSPPYWAHNHASSGHGHPFANHHNENLSTESLVPGAITLQDNEAEEDDADNSNDLLQAPRNSDETRTSYGRDRNKACWAKSVEVTDYVTVNGSATNIGAFVVWNIRVQTLSVSCSPRLYSSQLGNTDLLLTRCQINPGPLHEHSQAILGIRRLSAPIDTKLPCL